MERGAVYEIDKDKCSGSCDPCGVLEGCCVDAISSIVEDGKKHMAIIKDLCVQCGACTDNCSAVVER